MRLPRVIRWEFRHTVTGKQFIITTIMLPAMISIAIFAASAAGAFADAGRPSNPPPPYIIGLFLAMILFIGAFLSGVMTLYGVVKEKQNRVVEMVLSSISAWEMMAGKIIGLGFAGLIQVVIWSATAYLVARQFLPISLSTLTLVDWVTFPLYFVLGYLLIASMYASVGAVMKDVQSGGATGLVGLIPYSPMVFAAFIIQHPDALWIRIAGFFPPLTPAIMLLRIGATPTMTNGARAVPIWEIALSLFTLSVGVFFTMRFAARAFEVGMLMYGKTASFRELWRWGIKGRA